MNEIWAAIVEWLREQADRLLFIAAATLDRWAIDTHRHLLELDA